MVPQRLNFKTVSGQSMNKFLDGWFWDLPVNFIHFKTATDRNISRSCHFSWLTGLSIAKTWVNIHPLSPSGEKTQEKQLKNETLALFYVPFTVFFLSILQFSFCQFIFIKSYLVPGVHFLFNLKWRVLSILFLIVNTVMFRYTLLSPFFLNFCSIFFR